MSELERQFRTLLGIVENSPIDLVCPQCLRPFPRADVLYAHLRDKKTDPIHRGLGQRKTHFPYFLICYNLALGTSLQPEELPLDHRCFELRYVLEHNRAVSQSCTDGGIKQTSGRAHSLSKHLGSRGIASGRQVNYTAPVYSDKEPRGVHHRESEGEPRPCVYTASEKYEHLQFLDNEEVEAKIIELVPQLESWLYGALRVPGKVDSHIDDPGVVFPTTEIDMPLMEVRDLLYKGVGMFTLLRTYKETTTPQNFPQGIYTVLRVNRLGKIGQQEIGSAKSICVGCQTSLSAGLILLITCPPGIVISEASD